MKINLYFCAAMAIISFITISLVLAIGDPEPAVSAAILLISILTLGWSAGSASSSQEIYRLTRIESARNIQAQCHAAERDRLESANMQLSLDIDRAQYDAETWHEAHSIAVTRIHALQAENVVLANRPDLYLRAGQGRPAPARPDQNIEIN